MAQREIINLPGGRKDLTYSPAARVGNIIFVSGQGGADPETGQIAVNDIVAQTRVALGKIQRILEAAGASMDNVVKTMDYIVAEALPHYRETAQVRREFFKNGFPAATGVVVHRLLAREMLIEIDAVAVVD